MGFSRQEYWSGVPLPSPIVSARKLKRTWIWLLCLTVCLTLDKFLSPKGKQFYLSLSLILPSFNPFSLTPGLFLEHAKPTFILRPSLYSNIFFPKNSIMTALFKIVTLMHSQSLLLCFVLSFFLQHCCLLRTLFIISLSTRR